MFKNKIYWSLVSLLLLLAVVTGILTRTSYAIEDVSLGNILEKADQIQVQLNEDPHYLSIYFENQLTDLSQLQDQSEVIVKVKMTNERENKMHAVQSGVTVSEVYKGEGLQNGDRIYIYEPGFFYNSEVYFGYGGYNVMLEDEEYILFLKHLPVPKGYRYKGNEAITFLPVSSYFSKYPVSNHGTTQLLEENAEITYKEVKDFELLTVNKEMLTQYYSFKKEVMENFNTSEWTLMEKLPKGLYDW